MSGISRILLDVGSCDTDDELMKSAINLASRLQAELCGLFVEDIDLLHVANLPFTREISIFSAQAREFDESSVVRHLQIEAEKLRLQIEALAKVASVNWTFRIARGSRFDTILAEVTNFELLILMPDRQPYLRRSQPASAESNKPLILFFDDTPQSKRGIQVIRSLASNGFHGNIILLSTDEAAESKVCKQLQHEGYHVKEEQLTDGNIDSVIAYSKRVTPGLLVLPLEEQLIGQPEKIKELLNILSCPLILVR